MRWGTPPRISLFDIILFINNAVNTNRSSHGRIRKWSQMARVLITVFGFRCERCDHEWIPRRGVDEEPRVCPRCHSPWWNRPSKKARMSYDDFKGRIRDALRRAGRPLTWKELRTAANLPQAFPNIQWVRRMENDIGLLRRRESDRVIHWLLKGRER